ncbi:MAG: Gfo/Idh/MocA family oxidoreductase, partial [Verrucomicrobiales bacterium]|nr:Gfo/Idh/MocA family oxidoreductase [Verrucomicrobiales bacterium]
PPSKRLRVAVMGLSRGIAHIKSFSKVPGVEIVAVCDVDSQRLAKGVAETEKATGSKPRAVTDLRTILDDPSIDALSIAAPNFWHTPATVMACAAGKHVYVEKPGSYCAREAELITAAATKHSRKVQMGAQRRSLPLYEEFIGRLQAGDIGTLRTARCFYTNKRGSIGRGKPAQVPSHLNYELWQGPAPLRAYKDNLVHYNWHWHWHWGNGELGNNGVHALDIARWGLGVDLPNKATCSGGRYHFDDDQETPDTTTAVYDYGHVSASWEGSSCLQRKGENLPFVAFYGDSGTLLTSGRHDYKILDPEGKEIESKQAAFTDLPHFQNFVDAVRDDTPLNLPIDDAQKSALLCHIGNISYQTGKTVHLDPGDLTKSHSLPNWSRDTYTAAFSPGT